MRRWLRQFVRKRTNPMSYDYAFKMKHKLSVAYAFAAYNAFGLFLAILLYQNYPMTAKEKRDPAKYYARIWQGENVHVYKVDGLRLVDAYQVEGVPQLIPDPSEMEEGVEKKPAGSEELLTG